MSKRQMTIFQRLDNLLDKTAENQVQKYQFDAKVCGMSGAEVKRLIRLDPEFRRFSMSCIFPDHPRQRSSKHPVNLERSATLIEEDLCPLSVKETCRRQGNLHAVWDTCIIETPLGMETDEIAAAPRETVTDENCTEWTAAPPTEGANESFRIAISPEVQYGVQAEGVCRYAQDNIELDGDDPERVVLDAADRERHLPTIKIEAGGTAKHTNSRVQASIPARNGRVHPFARPIFWRWQPCRKRSTHPE
jgi:hypothetical protein